jgi:uncharacterized protein YecA (UPF0149 family)
MEASTCPISRESYCIHPLALQIRPNQANDADQPTFQEILRMPYNEQQEWFDSMDAELAGLHRLKCFTIVNKAKAAG